MLRRPEGRAPGVLGLALVALLVGAGSPEPSPVVDAVRKGDRERLRTLIENGADVNATERDGSTALLWASHRDDPESVELLIRAGADVDAANDLGATPVWAAGENGSARVMERLLAAGADPNSALLNGETPLIVASRAGNPRVVEMLLAHGADPDATGPRDQTALMAAAARSHAEVVEVLVRHGADVHARSETWRMLMAQPPAGHPRHQALFEHGGNTALMFAARAGDVASARHLVAAGADVDDRSAWGVTALTLAAYSDFGPLVASPSFGGGGPYHIGGREVFGTGRHGELVRFLLEAGADPDLGAGQFTALHAAIMRRDEAVVDLLLEHGANPNLWLGAWTPLDRGSNTDFYFHRAWVGASPLWLAARFGTARMIRRLAEHGADLQFVHRGEYYAGGRGGEQSQLQADISTPLMAAVGMSGTGRAWVFLPREEREPDALEKVTVLVELGADLNAVDQRGRTALDGAGALRYDSVVELLVRAGAISGDVSGDGEPREPGRD